MLFKESCKKFLSEKEKAKREEAFTIVQVTISKWLFWVFQKEVKQKGDAP
jgi:hypothetical protein